MNISSNVSSLASSIFSKLDTKNQGYLEKTDLQSAFANIDSSSSSSDTDAIFSQMDADKDGKITKSELTTGINNLVDQLNSQLNSSRTGSGMPPPPGGMPPPPSSSSSSGSTDDAGFTKDELTKIASSTDDTNLSSLMKKIASNFEAADTNQDGKVSSQEAMAYQNSTDSASSGNSSASTSSSTSTNQQAATALMKIAQLIQAYGLSDSSESNTVSATA